MAAEELSADEARWAALRAQGLLGATGRPAGATAVLHLVEAVQLDTISVLARSHELVCYARAGAIGRQAVEASLWGRDDDGGPRGVEYWAHAASVLPVTAWPWLAFRRRQMRAKRRWNLDAPTAVIADVRRRLAAEGPLTAAGLGAAKNGGPWWDWSPVKVAVELLLDWCACSGGAGGGCTTSSSGPSRRGCWRTANPTTAPACANW